jgi:hypothetical protein
MDKCNLCGNLLRINGTTKKTFDIPDDPTHAKLVTYQNQTCMNSRSVDNGGNPCPNVGNIVATIEHEEIIERG